MIDIQTLKKQNNLVVNDDGLIYVKPLDEICFTTYPLETLEGCLALTIEEYLGLRAGYYMFEEDLNSVVVATEDRLEKYRAEINLLEEGLKNE